MKKVDKKNGGGEGSKQGGSKNVNKWGKNKKGKKKRQKKENEKLIMSQRNKRKK